ncbi:MAG: KH domain-containing protein [Oscillospiraceae bacterium]|jgi:predicted RNA-binding protein YlqC (UPF0109 family)|nr:KH domain-containing protein [Oscillospiraceae bacterium]
MAELLKYITASLVAHPEDVVIKETPGKDSITLELHVHPDDMGKVIGKQGRIAKSIRQIVKAATPRQSPSVFLEIV